MRPNLSTTEARGRGSLLLLGCGIATTADIWAPALDHLAEHFTVMVWELPGHGSSPAPAEPFTMQELAESVAQVAERAGHGNHYFHAGVSLGGAVSLELALLPSRRPAGVATICSAARLATEEFWLGRAEMSLLEGMGPVASGIADRWFTPEFALTRRDVVDATVREALGVNPRGYAACSSALAHHDVSNRLTEIAVPVLAVAGRKDPLVSVSDAELIAEETGGEIAVLAGSHLAVLEQPRAIADLISGYFSS